jgi:undecaprenyl-diphosphatase
MNIPDSIVTILLGMIEGFTEFLPISSTAHLIIAEHFLGTRPDAFNVIIQLGAVQAVVLIYWRELVTMAVGWKEPAIRDYILKIGLSVGVTIVGILGLKSGVPRLGALFGQHWQVKLPEELAPIVGALLVGALLIFAAERFLRNHKSTLEITWSMAFWVGMAQILAAVFPGTSRSGATIIAAMFCGVARTKATEFSFLIGIPTMFAASVYSAKDAYDSGQFIGSGIYDLAVGYVISAITAFIVVKWLIRFVQSNTFIPFAWYRVVLSFILIAVLWGNRDLLPADLQHPPLNIPSQEQTPAEELPLPESVTPTEAEPAEEPPPDADHSSEENP